MKKMPYRKIIFLLVSAIAILGPVSAEQRVWTLADGTTFEAELVKIFAVEVAFKNSKGKIKKIPLELFSPESRTLIELEQPPKLAFESDTAVTPQGPITQAKRSLRHLWRMWVHHKQSLPLDTVDMPSIQATGPAP